jgi:hypothetical protein
MADIGALSILLGKWFPRVIGMLSLIAVQFPFTLLAITLGGVTQAQVNAVYVALLLHLLSIGCYSLLASVYCRNTGTACRVAFSAIFLRWMIPALAGLLATINAGAAPNPLLALLSRANDLGVNSLTARAFDTTFAGSPFPPAAVYWLAESVFVFFLAWMLFEPCTQGDVLSEAPPSVWTRWMARKQRSNHRRAWTAAISGKDYMLLAGGLRGTCLRFAAYMAIVLTFLGFVSSTGGHLSHNDVGGMLLSFGFGFLALDIIQSSAKVFRVELQEQTWSALMMLPKTLNGIAWAKIGGCIVGWWPSLLMIALGGLLVPNVISSILEGIFSPDTFFVVAYFVMQVVLFLELTVLTSISLTWAAWPLAAPLSFFSLFIANGMLLTCLMTAFATSGNNFQVVFFLLTGVSAVLAAILYQRIGARLLNKASDGA